MNQCSNRLLITVVLFYIGFCRRHTVPALLLRNSVYNDTIIFILLLCEVLLQIRTPLQLYDLFL